jgi:hypothetical protein
MSACHVSQLLLGLAGCLAVQPHAAWCSRHAVACVAVCWRLDQPQPAEVIYLRPRLFSACLMLQGRHHGFTFVGWLCGCWESVRWQ